MSKTSNVAKAAAVFTAFQTGQEVYNRFKEKYDNSLLYTVTIKETDPLYENILEWIYQATSKTKRRKVMAFTVRMEDTDDYRLKVLHDETKSVKVNIDGHKVFVYVDVPEGISNGSRVMRETAVRMEACKIKFSCHSKEAQEAVIEHLNSLAEKKSRSKSVLRIANTWGGWTRRSDIPPRELDSIILPDEQKNRIVNDLETFIDSEGAYARLGIPWHRGYLFHGPPGTGKTSLVKGLAKHFGLDLWYIPLADLKGEASLLELVNGVSSKSLLLLEDVDTIAASHSREEVKEGSNDQMSLGALLNALDGVATPHGLITIMTTNHLDRLDPALTRAGRMDMIEHIGLPGRSEIAKLYEFFYGEPWPDSQYLDIIMKDSSPSQSQVAECFKRHLNDPSGAIKELLNLVSVKVKM